MLFVEVTQMYSNMIEVYSCNAILLSEIIYQYSTINNSDKKWYCWTKFGGRFSNLLEIKRTKYYLDLFRFDISVARYLGVTFFPDTVYIYSS